MNNFKKEPILYINNIINPSNGHFLLHEILQTKINIKSKYMETLKIQSSIHKKLDKNLKQNTYSTPISNIQTNILINKSKREIVEIKCKDWHLINNIMHMNKQLQHGRISIQIFKMPIICR